MSEKKGKVWLVGAGPGDPGLITVKGADCIQNSDVIIYDYLASPTLLKHAPESVELIYVGKKGGDHTMPQKEINELICEKAEAGFAVTRLKGGDPFIFGRGGEEVETLVSRGIPFEIVPGVTSAVAAPAYAGIPLTHRDYTSTVAFVTGHEDPTKAESRIDWAALAKGIGTIVFLMGVKNLPNIVKRLTQHGMKPEMPVALVQWGTTPGQTTVTGTLGTIVEDVKTAGLKPPAIIVVGEVVSLRSDMKWFENRPLMGRKIVVTRAREQSSDLVKILTDQGADCLEYPTIKTVPPDNWQYLDAAIKRISMYDWIVFTSVNGVKFFFERLFFKSKDARALGNIRTASIGPATAETLLGFGVGTDVLPETYRAESVIEAFEKENINGKKILLPRAAEARPILPIELRNMGAVVDEVAAYKTLPVHDNIEKLLGHLAQGTIDMVTFTSSSTVKNFKALLPTDKNMKTLLKGVTIAVIGPITEETAKNLGFDVHIVADSYTIPGLCEAIADYYR